MSKLVFKIPTIAAGAKAGQFLRFDALGNYRETVDYLTNGLGTIYKVRADGRTMQREFF